MSVFSIKVFVGIDTNGVVQVIADSQEQVIHQLRALTGDLLIPTTDGPLVLRDTLGHSVFVIRTIRWEITQ